MRPSTNSTSPLLSAPEGQRPFGWVDIAVLLGLFGLLWSILHFGSGMLVHFDEKAQPILSTDLSQIPYYAGRTLLRMWIAFVFSLLFTFLIGYIAARSRPARTVILPALDVLQSVPVLGFLSATVTGFMALFPGSLLGVECASIFAIFTGQVWNMTFGFYHSLVTIPADLQEAATTYRLNLWQRFTTVQVPASMHSLIWNSMMSFGGGWFFVSQSEAISVMNKNIKLPGLGSYMATALEQGDNKAVFWAIVAMLVLILATDQLVWRPLLAWANKFKMELTDSGEAPTSWLYQILRRATVFDTLREKFWVPISDLFRNLTFRLLPERVFERKPRPQWAAKVFQHVFTGAFLLWVGYYMVLGLVAGISTVHGHVSGESLRSVVWLGFLTLLRVLCMTVVATLVWTPIGVWIGLKPRVARAAQPLAQIAASFPVNMTFPLVVGFYASHAVTMNWGSILLIGMGTQWYLLFNVIAGAMAIPNDLKEAARTYGLKGWKLWRTLIIPAIFPFWITGACTAAGGAWNASIVAEVAAWGTTKLKAQGLGAFIADATERGDTPMIITSIAVMSVFVIFMNKLLWRPLYALAERRFRLD